MVDADRSWNTAIFDKFFENIRSNDSGDDGGRTGICDCGVICKSEFTFAVRVVDVDALNGVNCWVLVSDEPIVQNRGEKFVDDADDDIDVDRKLLGISDCDVDVENTLEWTEANAQDLFREWIRGCTEQFESIIDTELEIEFEADEKNDLVEGDVFIWGVV